MSFSEAWDATTANFDDPDVSWEGYRAGTLDRIAVTGGANQLGRVATQYPNPITATAYDGLNNPMPGVPITLTAPATGPTVAFSNGTQTITQPTGADGRAVFAAPTANTISGTVPITAAADLVVSVGFVITQTADVPAAIAAAGGDNQTTQVDLIYPAGFQARLADRFDNPIPGYTVVFAAPTLLGPSGYWATPGTTLYQTATNGLGVATAPNTFRANTIAGAFPVAVNPVGDTSIAAVFSCENTAGPAVLILATNGTPQAAEIGGDYPAPFVAAVSDQWGNGAGGRDVTFAAPTTPPTGTFAGGGDTETVITAPDGTATPSTFTADQTTGTFRLAATSAGVPGEAVFLCTNMLVRDPLFGEGEFEFVSPDGEGITLRVLRGQFGRLMPVVELFEEQVPGVPGYRYLGARHASRDINLPCLVESVYEGIAALRQLARVLDPTKGVGSLRVRLPDGTVRQIGATYAGGLDASREENPHAIWAPLVFRTPDPYWTDGVEQTAQAPAGAVSAEVVNDGDYETWPVIHLTAPAVFANPVLTNTAVNQKIDIRAAGRDMVIDCRPGYRSVVVDGRPNYAALTQDSELWPLVAGSQTVTFAAAPLNFTTTASWNRRYLAI